MKKIISLLLLVTSLSLNAQITKNNWLVGGGISFSYSKSKPEGAVDSEAFNINLSPDIGYFIWDKFAFGSRLDFDLNHYKSDNGNSNFKRLLVSPFLRFYFLDEEKMVNPFIEGSYRFSLINENNSQEFSAKGGIAIFLNNSVAYEIFLNYLNSTTQNQYIGSHTLLLGIGIQVHLKKN
ncbi:hypothetical protein C7S20_02625 [Christiangramia fulva]|uniref:Outer membrane protein beta-barrel domain-containing protein n=1 Tax=Christiangramia fulva TaxID=2126553 RepID=A0A2R3Z1V1_9FLAO|nr:hypothetical protein [Christiangramia fulva]AVR44243.1 hypothetical protein C7S20_02625 [Christiangramia fulva]